MENNTNSKKRARLLSITLAILFISLIITALIIGEKFMGLNDSVEYERSVFISQIAGQMKNNVVNSTESHKEKLRQFAVILDEIRPETFEDVSRLFPEYAGNGVHNSLFFLSSDCELYGINGAKQWVSMPYEEYFLKVLSEEYTLEFIRIGINQEFMVYSDLLAAPIEIDGHEISAIMYGWDSMEYRKALSFRLFEKKSSSLLVGTNGNIEIYPEDEDSESYGYNIFTYLENQGMSEKDLTTIEEMFKGTEDGTVLCEIVGSRWLFSVAYYSDLYRIFIMLPIQNTSARTYENLYGLIAAVVASFVILLMIVAIILIAVVRRHKTQQERELQTELLMKTAQAKNDFLAKMSHDIRTPLNGIIGMNYIAAAKVPPDSDDVKECLEKVDVAAQYLLGILNDILDMSKIESGDLKLSAKNFSMKELKNAVEGLMLSQIKDKNLSFIVEAQDTEGRYYIGDELRIKQILMNLLSNAVKFTDKGSVTLNIKICNADEIRDEVTFSVKDTGKGMSKEFMSYIFTPFTQEDDSIAAAYGGSGLGLSIAKSFVDMMGGNIEAFSEAGKGSEFEVTLLLERAEPPEVDNSEKHEEIPLDFKGKHLLLCEDNDLNAEITEVILETFNISTDRAENGRVGTELFEKSPPGYYDMIFMDVRMPELDGYEATRRIRSMKRADAGVIPICALSANAFSEDIKKSIEAGMNEHLAKPLDVDMLTGVLGKYLK